MPRSISYPTFVFNRRTFLTAAAAAAIAGRASMVGAQSMDPWDYMTAMTVDPAYGAPVGQPITETLEWDGQLWSSYLQMPVKEGQDFHFTCEFDSAWIVLKAFGHDVPLDEQLALVGVDESIEPYFVENGSVFDIYGGDVENFYCGHINDNFMARARCTAMSKVFTGKGLGVTKTPNRATIEAALLRGEPVYFKSTVDMMPWREAIWHTPAGQQYPVVFSNDHALTVMGFNQSYVIIRDPLGPTSTNWERPWQWYTTWDRFLEVLASQGNDAIAVAASPHNATPTG